MAGCGWGSGGDKGGGKGGDQGGGIELKHPIACAHCKEVMPASKLLIMHDEGHDWQGGLFALCFDCHSAQQLKFSEAVLGATEFKKRCKAGWRRQSAASRQLQSLRTFSFQQALEEIERDPNLTSKEHRRVVLAACKSFHSAYRKAFKAAAPLQQQAMEESIAWYEKEFEKKAADPTYVTPMDAKPTLLIEALDDNWAQYFSEVYSGVDEYFCCRKTDCMWFGLNTDCRNLR